MNTPRIENFSAEDKQLPVSFVETMLVKEGVNCDVYRFEDDDSRDLAVVTVQQGYKTPLQRVDSGDKTIEGYVSGKGTLTVRSTEGETKSFPFGPDGNGEPVVVELGQIMQWHADGDSDLVFYELCEPPYEDGRFDNLAD